MRFKELEIVIEPHKIEFPHVIQNHVYRQTIHVKNVGSKSKRIQIFRPTTKVVLTSSSDLFIYLLFDFYFIEFSIDS